jgi:hypothetical protein
VSERRVGIAHGLLPLLDITILLLGFFIVMMAQQSARGREGVYSGKAFVLLEVVPGADDDGYRIYATDESGKRTGRGRMLSDAASFVADALQAGDAAPPDDSQVIVVIGIGDVFEARTWSAEHTLDLRRALGRHRVLFLWGT